MDGHKIQQSSLRPPSTGLRCLAPDHPEKITNDKLARVFEIQASEKMNEVNFMV